MLGHDKAAHCAFLSPAFFLAAGYLLKNEWLTFGYDIAGARVQPALQGGMGGKPMIDISFTRKWKSKFVITLFVAAVWLTAAALAAAAQNAAGDERPTTGKGLYDAACASCHGADGKGADRSKLGFDTPLPDFSDCKFATREPDSDWSAITHLGGPARGFSKTMPASGDSLTDEEILKVVEHLRGFCTDRVWPRGDLNLPRPLVTEKAFPEDETVLTTIIATEGPGDVTNKFVYERRFGARNQVEFMLPFAAQQTGGPGWSGGVGDMALSVKRVLFASMRTGSIFSVSGETGLPTGDEKRGRGKGFTVFEPSVRFGQILPSDGFLQFQGGVELPARGHGAAKEAFWRTTVGRSFSQRKYGRTWSPMVELLGARELEAGAKPDWDLLPQFQVTLSARQHILFNFGVLTPLNNAGPRTTQVMMYVIWDWADGGLFQGWK